MNTVMIDTCEPTRSATLVAEIKAKLRQYFPRGQAAAAYFELVEKRRGIAAATALRDGVRDAWKVKQAEGRK